MPDAADPPPGAPPDADRILAVANDAARAGGDVLVRTFGTGLVHRSKQAAELVSDADLESEAVIATVLRDAFSGHAILGEEAHAAGSDPAGGALPEHLWVVDPLDGTNNFVHGVDHVAVSIAYYHAGRPVVGVVLNPLRDEHYWAVAGRGAFRGQTPLRVQEATGLDQCLVGVGFYYDRGAIMEATLAAIGDFFRRQIHGVRRFGAAALDLCSVASGRYGAFFEYTLAPWDFAAGRLIVAEAGGLVTTARGDELPLARSSILACTPAVQAACLDVTRRHHPQ